MLPEYRQPKLALLILFLLIIRFDQSNGSFICFHEKYYSCYALTIFKEGDNSCNAVNQTIECLGEKAIQCGIEDSGVVKDMKQFFTDTCQKDHEVYRKYRTCISTRLPGWVTLQCARDFNEALRKDRGSDSTTAPNDLGSLKHACRFKEEVHQCLYNKITEICSEDVLEFHRKLTAPINDLVTKACIEAGTRTGSFMKNVPDDAAPLEFVWKIVFQSLFFLFALKYFKLTL